MIHPLRHQDLAQRLESYRAAAEEARRALDAELRSVCPSVALREVERKRRAAEDALRLLIVAELYAGLQDDSDATVSWMQACVEAGEIVDTAPAEDAW